MGVNGGQRDASSKDASDKESHGTSDERSGKASHETSDEASTEESDDASDEGSGGGCWVTCRSGEMFEQRGIIL